MNYRLSFTGQGSPEITHLLHAVEHRLNQHVTVPQLGDDPAASGMSMTASKCPNGKSPGCIDTDPRGPWHFVPHSPLLFIGLLLVAFAAGFGVAMMIKIGRSNIQ